LAQLVLLEQGTFKAEMVVTLQRLDQLLLAAVAVVLFLTGELTAAEMVDQAVEMVALITAGP
jgi:hypothetical protein